MTKTSVRFDRGGFRLFGLVLVLAAVLLAVPSSAYAGAVLFFDKTVSVPEDGCPGFPFGAFVAGGTALYCYEIFNFGDAPLLDVQIVDDNGTPGDPADDFFVKLEGLTDEDGDGDEDDLGPFGGFAFGEAEITLLEAGFFESFAEASGIDQESGEEISEPALALLLVEPFVLGPCTPVPFGAANAFDLFIFHNLDHHDTDTTGRVGVGDNANLMNYGIGIALPNSNGTRDDLVVGMNLVYTNGTVYNGNVVYGVSGNLTNVTLFNGTASSGTPVDFFANETYLLGASDYWGDIPTLNGTVTIQPWGGIFLDGVDPEINIFNISGEDLAKAVYFQITAPPGSSVLVNVTPRNDGTNLIQNFGFALNGGVNRDHVAFHFPNTQELTIFGIGVQGTIFAPIANINFNNASIDGIMIGANLSGNGEVHHVGFTGCLPLPDDTNPE